MGYKEKLIGFNATPKYRLEMEFMQFMVDPQPQDIILDYGCGTGTMWNLIKDKCRKCWAHDIVNYFDYDQSYFKETVFASVRSIKAALVVTYKF